MRLFKKRCSDTSPQLVSATPIPQDAIPALIEAPEEAEQETESVKINGESSTRRKSDTEIVPEGGNQTPTTLQSSYSARKGISTWGRKVGRRWDQLKRSDSSELLAVSGRRRRHWSPNRQIENPEASPADDRRKIVTAEFPKPKRVSRVESLRNLFRTGERGSSSVALDSISRSATISEEETSGTTDRYRMDKAMSEGSGSVLTLRNSVSFEEGYSGVEHKNCDRETLRGKKSQLSRSIQNLQEQQRVLDFILTNQNILKTREGADLAKCTLEAAKRSPRPRSMIAEVPQSAIDISASEMQNHQLSYVKRNLFCQQPSSKERNEARGSSSSSSSTSSSIASSLIPLSGLEDLMSGLRVGCDESGYDSDSTRTGADSPDSGKSVPSVPASSSGSEEANNQARRFSITSYDYHGIDLSMASTPKKNKNPKEKISNVPAPAEESNATDSTISVEDSLNDSSATETTVLTYQDADDDTDSCDEDTYLPNIEPRDLEADDFAHETLTMSKMSSKSSGIGSMASSSFSREERAPCTPVKKSLPLVSDPLLLEQQVKSQTPGTGSKPVPRGRSNSNTSLLHLLENADSPCKDSPPAIKGRLLNSSLMNVPCYFSPKRSRSGLELEENLAKRQVHSEDSESVKINSKTNSSKGLVRRELKTMKLIFEKPGGLGVAVERREAARPYYVVSKVDDNGEAAKGGQIRVGDEIVRVCGRRLRGMSAAEARTALRSCCGTVELQIAREPSFAFGELGDTWGEVVMSRARSESDVWKLKRPNSVEENEDDKNIEKEEDREDDEEAMDDASCAIVGALTKDGKTISVNTMDQLISPEEEKSIPVVEEVERKGLTGMKKFHVVKKRNTGGNSTPYTRRATSLSVNLITITLKKGADKKLGFSIVGGSDSTKGSMGIFVKDVMLGGQAAEEGTLRVGDEILAINGTPMNGLTHAKALQAFKAAKPGDLILHVGRRDPTHNKRYIVQSKSYDALDKLTECGEE